MIAVLDVFLELKAEVDGLVGVVRLQKVAKVLDDDVRVVVGLKVVAVLSRVLCKVRSYSQPACTRTLHNSRGLQCNEH